MRLLSMAAAAAFSIALIGPAFAFSPVTSAQKPLGFEQVKSKYKWESGGCKYEYKADRATCKTLDGRAGVGKRSLFEGRSR